MWRTNLTKPPSKKSLQSPRREILVVSNTAQTDVLSSVQLSSSVVTTSPPLCEAELSPRQVVPYLKSLPSRRLPMELILVIVVLVLLFGGGGYWGRRRGHW